MIDWDEWTEWHGGEQPVENQTRVDVMFGDGEVVRNMKAGTWDWSWSDRFGSLGSPDNSHITAYKVVDRSFEN
jgi:hypothetical protein